MSASEAIHPTLNDLTYEIGQVLVCWCFLENSIREHLNRAGLENQILKGPVISHWRTYIQSTYPERAHELLEPVEKVARVRNLLAHCIYSLHADPWTEGSAVIACEAPDGTRHSFSIDDLRATCTELSKLKVTPVRLSAAR
ncbi:hypothetical protein QE372_005036 [Agrobacterium pusense]|uniref:hypothetical protein n=1 Tax=Agrobacterium pusense TaxID=648995 RepID=UPI0028574A87|nr:hypothetical protein [Agrobacterium pusense]MDR6192702.1 hypothetical protein [Agrobacterium pusense]